MIFFNPILENELRYFNGESLDSNLNTVTYVL
jgi:hypothetical protein